MAPAERPFLVAELGTAPDEVAAGEVATVVGVDVDDIVFVVDKVSEGD